MANDTVAASPLEEANAVSLDELFSRDPEGYSSQDIDVIIKELRRQREAFAKAEAAGEATPRAKKSTGPKETLSLSDLGLG